MYNNSEAPLLEIKTPDENPHNIIITAKVISIGELTTTEVHTLNDLGELVTTTEETRLREVYLTDSAILTLGGQNV